MEIGSIEQPYDDYERRLLKLIHEEKLEYEKRVKPYVDAFVKSRASKPVKPYVIMNEAETEEYKLKYSSIMQQTTEKP